MDTKPTATEVRFVAGLTRASELQIDMKTNTGKHNKRIAKTMRWARNKTDQELSDFIARFPKAAGRLAASLFRENYVPPKTNNFKLDAAADILKRRREGRETYSPSG